MRNDNSVQRLNYSSWAAIALEGSSVKYNAKFPVTASMHLACAEMLKSSVKFILPNRGELLDPATMGQAHLDLTRLPYPITAFEAPWVGEDDGIRELNGMEQGACTKRIALCWELGNGHGEHLAGVEEQLLERYPQGGIMSLPIYWEDAQEQWTLQFGAVFLPYDQLLFTPAEEDHSTASAIARNALLDATEFKAVGKGMDSVQIIPVPLSTEYFRLMATQMGSEKKAIAQIILDGQDELRMVVQACSLLNCENVVFDDVPAPAKLNAKRKKQGKLPFYDFKVLALDQHNAKTESSATGDSGRKVRTHLRRGHIRRLKDRSIWVRAAVIAKSSDVGIVEKDYAL